MSDNTSEPAAEANLAAEAELVAAADTVEANAPEANLAAEVHLGAAERSARAWNAAVAEEAPAVAAEADAGDVNQEVYELRLPSGHALRLGGNYRLHKVRTLLGVLQNHADNQSAEVVAGSQAELNSMAAELTASAEHNARLSAELSASAELAAEAETANLAAEAETANLAAEANTELAAEANTELAAEAEVESLTAEA